MYIEYAEANDIVAAEREFVSVKAKLRRCREALDVQEAAKTRDAYETLSDRLTTYRNATEELSDDVSAATLDELKQLARDIESANTDIGDFESQRASLREERSCLETELETVQAELQPLEAREPNIEAVADALEAG